MSVKLLIFIAGVACKVGKQLCNYSMQYFNSGEYPLPQTVIVLVIEIFKLIITLFRTGCQLPSFSASSVKSSMGLMVPSVVYAINNNIYYGALMLVSPPIWMIITSIRTVLTACVYKYYLKREVTNLQFIGALLIVFSIAVTKIGDLTGDGDENYIPPIAFLLAIIASCNSVGAAIYTETLFKKSGQNFMEQQFWMYVYGILVNIVLHVASNSNFSFIDSLVNLEDVTTLVMGLLVGAIIFSSLDGFLIAEILKRFDNIVKEYSGAVDNIFTAIISSFLFPDKFELTVYIVMAMALLIFGIYLYEAKKPAPTSSKQGLA